MHCLVEFKCHFSWQVKLLFVAGALFGDVQVALFVAGAVFGDVELSLFVAGAAFGEI